MEMTETLSYKADPAAVFNMLCDRSWREQVCESINALDYDVQVAPAGAGITVTTRRTMPAAVPDAVRKLTGETITVTQVERWGAASSDGSRSADLDVAVAGQPAGMRGTIRLSPSGSGSNEVFSGDVKVSVPFIGRRIEPEIVKVFRAFIDKEGEVGRSYLAAR